MIRKYEPQYTHMIRKKTNNANYMIRMIRVFANHANHRFAGFAKHFICSESHANHMIRRSLVMVVLHVLVHRYFLHVFSIVSSN